MPIYILNGKEIDVPENEVEQFLRAFPNAQLAEQAMPGKPEPTSQGALVEPMQAPVMESNLGATSLASQSAPVVEAAIASPAPAQDRKLSFGESVKNSFRALGEQFGDVYEFWKGDRQSLDIATAAIANGIFGEENVDDYVKRQEARGKSPFWTKGLGTEEILSSMAGYEQEQMESQFETRGIIESFKDRDAAGVAAGIVNAMTNMVGSVGYLFGTAFTGFTADYIADNYVNYNRQRAQNKGVTFNDLIKSGEAEEFTPIAVAAGQTALEYIGVNRVLKAVGGKNVVSGLGQSIINKVSTSPAAQATLSSLYTSAGAGLTEYTTEIGQYALEKANEELGRVDGTDDPAEIIDVTLDAIFSEEGQEQGLQGFFGGGGVAVTGKNVKSLIATRNFVDADAVEKDIVELSNLAIKKEKQTSDVAREGIDLQMREVENRISEKVRKGRELYNTLSEGDKEQIDNFSKLADAAAFKVSELSQKRQSGEISDETFNIALEGFKSQFNENKKRISSLLETKVTEGTKKIADKIGVEIKTFETTEQVEKFIESEKNKGNNLKASAGNYGFITPDNTIVINKEAAQEDNVITTSAHELLHAVLAKTLKDSTTQTKIGKALLNEMNSIVPNLTETKYAQRLNQYLKKYKEGQIPQGNALEEAMTLLSEGLINGEIEYNETVFTRIGDVIRRLLSDFGIKARFDTGRDVFNFVRDYNEGVLKGELTRGQLRTVEEGAAGRLTIPEKVDPEDLRRFSKASLKGEDIDKFFADNPGKNFQTAEMFRGRVTKIVNDKYGDVPGYNTYKDLIVDEALTGNGGVLSLINTFTGGSLTGYANQIVGRDKDGRPVSLLERRITAVGNRILPPEFSQEITEIQEKVTGEQIELNIQQLEQAQVPQTRNTVDRLNLSPASKVKANDATKRILQTILPKTQVQKGFAFRTEFKKGVRDILYNDVREELGGKDKEAYLAYVNDNLETIYEIIPLDVMVKRLPQYVDQQFDANGKPLRSRVSFTGKQSAAGNLVFVKKPFNQIEEQFRTDFTEGRTALETRRKLLVETIAEEAAYDEIQDALNDPNVIAKLELTQEKQLSDEFAEDILRNAQRGAFTKYSLRLQEYAQNNPENLGLIYDVIPELNKEVKKGMPLGAAFEKLTNAFIPENIRQPIADELNERWLSETQAGTFSLVKGNIATKDLLFNLLNVDKSIYKSTEKGFEIAASKRKEFEQITKNLHDKGILTPEIIHSSSFKFGFINRLINRSKATDVQNFFDIQSTSEYEIEGPNTTAVFTSAKKIYSVFNGIREFLNDNNPSRFNEFHKNAMQHRPKLRTLMKSVLKEYHDGNLSLEYLLVFYNGLFDSGTKSPIRNSGILAKIHTDFISPNYKTERGKIDTRTLKTGTKDIIVDDFPSAENKPVPEHMDPIDHLKGKFFYGNGKNNLYNAIRNRDQSEQIIDKAIDLMFERNGIVLIPKNIERQINKANKTTIPNSKFVMSRAADIINSEQLVDFPTISELNQSAYSNDGLISDAILGNRADAANVKFSLRQTKRFLGKEISEMLDRKGSRAAQIRSAKGLVTARRLADEAKLNWKNKWNLYLPFNSEDYYGLIQKLAGTGQQGDKDLQIIKEELIDPYVQGTNDIETSRRNMMYNFEEAKKELYQNENVKFRNKLTDEKVNMFDNEDALRVYVWDSLGYNIPNISKNQQRLLVNHVNSNPGLKKFAGELKKIHKTDGYPEPKDTWDSGRIASDISDSLNKTQRLKYLDRWIKNIDVFLSEKNKAKIIAQFGTDYLRNLERVIARMKAGTNRVEPTGNKTIDAVLDYINDSVGTIMFWNMRSALLQTISTFNYMNWSDNNPLKFGEAMLNKNQYAKDWITLFNSDYLVNRRAGVRINIQEAELVEALNEPKNRGNNLWTAMYRAGRKQLANGFIPTKFADSFAISTGGAAFYRNRINSYKKQGFTEAEAENKALTDWKKLTNESQQSSDPARIANIQAGPLGRLVFAFANTPFQYARLTKRAISDLVNRRGDDITNLSKVGYYTVVQNLAFNMLQSALFAALFDEEEDEEFLDKKTERVLNGMADSLLRGIGFGGAALSMLKNVALKLKDESEQPNAYMKDVDSAVMSVSDISPPIDHKLRKLQRLSEIVVGKNYYDTNIPPSVEAAANAAALVNVPADRVLKKMENLYEAATYEMDLWQRMLMVMGWSSWDLGIEGEKLFEGEQSKGKGTKKRGVKQIGIKKIN